MPLTQYLTSDHIIAPLTSTRKIDAIRELAGLFAESAHVTDFRRFLSALLQKEQRFGSAVDKGVALPHYRDESIVQPIVGLGVSPNGVDWGDGANVNILVLVGWPDKHQAAYLKVVAEIASCLQQEDIRSSILNTTEPDRIVDLIRDPSSISLIS